MPPLELPDERIGLAGGKLLEAILVRHISGQRVQVIVGHPDPARRAIYPAALPVVNHRCSCLHDPLLLILDGLDRYLDALLDVRGRPDDVNRLLHAARPSCRPEHLRHPLVVDNLRREVSLLTGLLGVKPGHID